MSRLDRQPLDLSVFPQQLQMMVFGPQAPPPMKMMAARGTAPGAPPELGLSIMYQLQFGDDAASKQAAQESIEQMPPEILVPQLQKPQPVGVLDWVAEVRQKDGAILQAVVLNQQSDDLTIAYIAEIADARVCDTISQNQMRILRSPAILEKLYANANARMATVDKLVDLAQRNGVSLKGLPGLQNALDSGQDIGLGETEAQGQDDAFARVLQDDVERADQEVSPEQEEEALQNMTRRERELHEKKQAEEAPSGPLFVQIQTMNIAQKIRLATMGSREAINLLVRDSNRLVHMAAVQSPRLQYSDVKKIAANKSMPDGVIRHIAKQRNWIKHYDIMLSLANNPKTPVPEAMNFLNHLRTNDLRMLMKNRNIATQISRQAKILVNKRTR